MDTTITLQPLHHRGQESIALYYKNDPGLNRQVRMLPDVKWSQSNQCWYVPLSEESYQHIVKAVKEKAVLDNTALKTYLEKKKKVAATLPVGQKKAVIKPLSSSPAWKLSPENLQALEKFVEQLKLKAYSPSTIKTYRNEFLQLLQLLKNKAVDELRPDDLRRYMVYTMEKEGIRENTAHSRLNALKFYFEQVLHREKFFWEIPRPKKAKQLPRLFTQQEITAILNSLSNKKHKVMVMLGYGAGLRVSEIVALKTADIDSKRMSLFIRAAKGKKDRMVALSPVLLVMLREYAHDYKPERSGYLFEGSNKGQPYSTRSLQEVLQSAKTKAGIIKSGSIHSLRHSFATHLLDKGTDVTMIQKLLGHNDIKTTLIYLHTSNKDLLKIVSPLDDLALL